MLRAGARRRVLGRVAKRRRAFRDADAHAEEASRSSDQAGLPFEGDRRGARRGEEGRPSTVTGTWEPDGAPPQQLVQVGEGYRWPGIFASVSGCLAEHHGGSGKTPPVVQRTSDTTSC